MPNAGMMTTSSGCRSSMSACLFLPRRFLMPNEADLIVDFGVVNDFAEDKEPAVLENFARGIGQIDRALDAVTKAKLLRQSHSHVANANDSPARRILSTISLR